jgi:hypothetical protein
MNFVMRQLKEEVGFGQAFDSQLRKGCIGGGDCCRRSTAIVGLATND